MRAWAGKGVGLRDESGGSLPAVLIALAVGVVLLSPFLAHVSSRMLAIRDVESSLGSQYASDSGVEFGIWNVLHNSVFKASVDAAPLTPITLNPAVSVNGTSVTTTVELATCPSWSPSSRTCSIASPPFSVGAGGTLAYDPDNGRIYALGGDKGTDFAYYSLANDVWVSQPSTPGTVGDGGALVYANGALYALQGNKDKGFWAFNGASWSALASAPDKVGAGGSLAYDPSHNRLYAFRGDKNSDFWYYDISGHSWNSLASAPDKVGEGGSLAYVAGKVYAFRGDKTPDFWVYSGGWSTLQSAPSPVGAGGALAFNLGNYLMALAGDKSTDFWAYDLANDSWSGLGSTPDKVGAGGALSYPGGDYFYALGGDKSSHFWRYLKVPPKYDIVSTDGSLTTSVEIQLTGGTSVSVVYWTLQ